MLRWRKGIMSPTSRLCCNSTSTATLPLVGGMHCTVLCVNSTLILNVTRRAIAAIIIVDNRVLVAKCTACLPLYQYHTAHPADANCSACTVADSCFFHMHAVLHNHPACFVTNRPGHNMHHTAPQQHTNPSCSHYKILWSATAVASSHAATATCGTSEQHHHAAHIA